MLIYKINFSLLTLLSLLIYIFCGRGLKGRAGCRQTEVQTDKQTNRQTISRGYAKELANRLKTARGQGAPIPVLTILVQTRHEASRPATSITRLGNTFLHFNIKCCNLVLPKFGSLWSECSMPFLTP